MLMSAKAFDQNWIKIKASNVRTLFLVKPFNKNQGSEGENVGFS